MRSQQIEEIAAQWLSKRDGGAWSEADEAQLLRWLDDSPVHKVEYLRLRRAWNQANKLRALGAGLAAAEVPPRGQWRLTAFPPHGAQQANVADASSGIDESTVPLPGAGGEAGERTRRLRWLGIAASAVICVTIAGGWWVTQQGRESYATAIGRIERVPLTDGSQITLNTNSKIDVKITETQRRIDLREGEAFFDVAKDASRPFIVYAGDQRVIAVGTQFSVWRTGSSARVVVVEGRVRIETLTENPGSEHAMELGAGAVARADARGVVMTDPQLHQAETSLAWRAGYLHFRDTSLSEAVAEFNRYNVRKLVIADPTIADMRIGANLRMNNVAAFVRVLEQEFDVQASDRGDQILLSARRDGP